MRDHLNDYRDERSLFIPSHCHCFDSAYKRKAKRTRARLLSKEYIRKLYQKIRLKLVLFRRVMDRLARNDASRSHLWRLYGISVSVYIGQSKWMRRVARTFFAKKKSVLNKRIFPCISAYIRVIENLNYGLLWVESFVCVCWNLTNRMPCQRGKKPDSFILYDSMCKFVISPKLFK